MPPSLREGLTVDPGRLLTALLKVRVDRDPRITDVRQ